MNIIIVGCGRVGETLAEKLNDDGNIVTIIDMSSTKVKNIANKFDIMGIVGNGATHMVQKEAGIDDADLLIAVTNSDELNLLCCMVAKKAGNCQTIARVKNPEYSTEAPYLKDELGLAMVINPEYAAAEEIARVLKFPSAMNIETFAKGKIELIKFKIPKNSRIVGMSVKELTTKLHCDVLVCTIERGEDAYIANGDFRFEEKDIISFVASHKNATDFFAKIDHKGNTIKNAIVVGGHVTTHYLCDIMESSGVSMKIIEKDRKICEELCTRWKNVDVINGDTADKELLIEEGIASTDAFVALSGLDEENIILSLFAQSSNVGKIITKINRIDYDNVLNRLELDTILSPKNITSDMILRYVRATQNTVGSNVETLYNVIQDEVEAAEFIVKENSPIVNIPLCELKFKPNVLVAAIIRDGVIITPRGHDTIQVGDAVVIVSKLMALHDITDILK
ncbi:MAG: Trk system potassium transporter TrkA [Ruminococcaceae bacterium]|nr:Trk system potassium transporter TrkA [Oscillospiraceae bacterium]